MELLVGQLRIVNRYTHTIKIPDRMSPALIFC